ncbi:MAG: type II toxin-antitoxin system Phd/YefM family antitoxin [Candidatus Omnitrophica bacterium]|nr:type II toxin-antitoxin system Phd/YefM family antitoxin [Candidatus Omnitrophota bacterium]
MTRTLSLSEVKMKFSALVEDVTGKDDEIVITRNGRPVAVLLSAEEFDSWKETEEIKNSPALMREIQAGIKRLSKGPGKKYSSTKALF